MKTEIRYFTKTGNTKKLADAIAQAAQCQAQSIPAPLAGYTDILFLGASVYGGGIQAVIQFFSKSGGSMYLKNYHPTFMIHVTLPDGTESIILPGI